MTALLAAFAAILILAACSAIAYSFGRANGVTEGHARGYSIGRDAGWNEAVCDRLNRDASRDRARRNRIGQFKPRKPGNLDLTCNG